MSLADKSVHDFYFPKGLEIIAVCRKCKNEDTFALDNDYLGEDFDDDAENATAWSDYLEEQVGYVDGVCEDCREAARWADADHEAQRGCNACHAEMEERA